MIRCMDYIIEDGLDDRSTSEEIIALAMELTHSRVVINHSIFYEFNNSQIIVKVLEFQFIKTS